MLRAAGVPRQAQPAPSLDGPTPLGVDAVLPVLEEHGAQATFFLTGDEVARRPDLAARLVRAGQERKLQLQPCPNGRPFQVVLRSGDQKDRRAAAPGRWLTRAVPPPYGKKLIGPPLVVQRQGLRMVLWDIDDPDVTDTSAFADQIAAEARPGSIILLHAMYPGNKTARQALPLILEGLEAKGLQAVSVGTLLNTARELGDRQSSPFSRRP